MPSAAWAGTGRAAAIRPGAKTRICRTTFGPACSAIRHSSAAVCKPIRANNEGLNGRGKGHRVDLAEPKRRLAHGRAAQTILVALTICTLNLQILHDWKHTTGTTEPIPAPEDDQPSPRPVPGELAAIGRPPPDG